MDFHIGSFIKKVADQQKKGPTELGREINTSKQNVYGIFKRKSIDTQLLVKLSRALNYDFFMEYVRRLEMSPSERLNGVAHSDGQVGALQREVESLRRENILIRELLDVYKKMNPTVESQT